MFMITQYYLIKPNEALLKAHRPMDWFKPRIWKHQTWDATRDQENTLYMKLLFLASRYETQIVFEKAYPEEKETIQSIQAVLGSPPYTAKTFDTWWTIEYIQSSQDSLDVIKDLSLEALSALDATENRVVDSWIRRDRAEKKDQDSSETTTPRVKSIQYSIQEIWLRDLMSEDWPPIDLKAYWALRLHSELVGDPQDFGFDAEQWKEWLLVHSPGFKEWMNFQDGLKRRMQEYDDLSTEEKNNEE